GRPREEEAQGRHAHRHDRQLRQDEGAADL
ncbi:MAG: hypothetical protein AVDCRST_MAG76-2596, partial [uncultured Acidimicrobiales bacterium]